VSRTHPTNIFIGSVQIDSEVMRCTYDNYDIFQNQWFGACYFLGDLWREKNTTTAISIDGLNEERGPVPVLTETCVGRGIMKCDSNDAYLDRGLANTKYNKYPEHKASVHNNNELLVSDGDINYKFDPKGLGKGRCEDIFPPTDHDLALSHNILTIGVHGKGAGEALRDQKIWTSVGLADDVYSDWIRVQMAKKCLIKKEDNLLDGNPLVEDPEYQAACSANEIMRCLSIYPYIPCGDIKDSLWKKDYIAEDKKAKEEGKSPSGYAHKDCWLRKYHHLAEEEDLKVAESGIFHPCHKPGWRKGKPATLSYTGNCLCEAYCAKGAWGCFADKDDGLTWQDVHRGTEKLLPFYEKLRKSSTHRDKETFVTFKSVLVETREHNTNGKKWVIIGEDAQPSNKPSHLGMGTGLPPLCLNALAHMVGDYSFWGDPKKKDETMFSRDFVEGCLQRPTYDDLKAAEGVPSIGEFYKGKEKKPKPGYRAQELGHLILYHACAVFIHLGKSIKEGKKPIMPTKYELFRHWQIGDTTPITRSMATRPQTFKVNYMNAVRPFFDTDTTKKEKHQAIRFTIAHHNTNYISEAGEVNHTVVKLNRVGSYAFISTDNEKKKKMHTTDGIVAVELQTTTKSFLEQLTNEGMGGNILPKREGQVFFGAPMDRFTCGMRTFLSCGRTGALTNDREEDGMYLLFKDGLESGNVEDQNNKKKQVKDFVTYLVSCSFFMLL
jgi:hypothetical protein